MNVIPLESRFISQLDKYTDNLMKVFRKKDGVSGNKIRQIMALTGKVCDQALSQLTTQAIAFKFYFHKEGLDMNKKHLRDTRVSKWYTL